MPVVIAGIEYFLLIVTPVDYMVRYIDYGISGNSRHLQEY